MNCIEQVCEIIDLLYKHNWDERNGGNLSYIVSEEEVKEICNPENIIREFKYNFDLSALIGKYFIITGNKYSISS
jgi:rhamnulose-1-phosphate aldolase